MKNFIITAALAAVLFVTGTAHAIIVSDPGAYARFAQQIQQLQQQLSVLQSTYKTAQDQLTAVTGNLGRGTGVESSLQNLLKLSKTNTHAIHNLPSMDVAKLNFSDAADTQSVLDKLYAHDQDVFKQGATQKSRDLYKQRTIKASLENSEFLISKQQESLTKIQDLANKINETKNVKDAQDLTNRILIEMLTVQNQQLLLTAQLTRAEQAQKYQGVATEDDKDFQPEPPKPNNKVGGTFSQESWAAVGGMEPTSEQCKHYGGCN